MSQTFNVNTYRAASMICHEIGVPLAELQALGKWGLKRRGVVAKRSVVAMRLRRLGHSFPCIGHVLGVDHSCILLMQKREERKAAGWR